MQARALVGTMLGTLLALGSVAVADEPKPTVVDIKPIKDAAIVLVDAKGGTYVVVHKDHRKPDSGLENAVYFGTGKTLYKQRGVGAGANGDAWWINIWAPRLPDIRPGSVNRNADGTFKKECDGKDDAALTQVTGDKAKKILDTYAFMSPALVRIPYLLARDDTGTYYYVDAQRVESTSNVFRYRAHRVFVGKKGSMKQITLTNTASDTAGDVFSSASGDLRLVRRSNADDGNREVVSFVKGGKKVELVWLDVDANSQVIFSELGVYTFIGTICDNVRD